MYQHRLINDNKCTTLMGGVDNGGGCAWGVGREYREISIPPTQFCCGLKTTLKKK